MMIRINKDDQSDDDNDDDKNDCNDDSGMKITLNL